VNTAQWVTHSPRLLPQQGTLIGAAVRKSCRALPPSRWDPLSLGKTDFCVCMCAQCVAAEQPTDVTLCLRRRRAMAAAASGDVPAVVSPQWLSERLGRPDVRVLDASWYMPAMGA
jgi:hypothetical protein